MTEQQLRKIALYYHEKWYWEQLRDWDDLYNATDEEKDQCCEYYYEIDQIWQVEFRKTII